ncbi:hypothetical protein ARSEF4850_002410 [Beauveria asiatica]
MKPAHSVTESLSEASLLHTQPTKYPALVASASGACSTLSDGRVVLDACGVAIIGHGDETVKFAIQEQLDKAAYAHPIMHTTSPTKDLAEFLLLGAPSLGLSKAYFASSGSDAVEAAMKLVVAFHRANKRPHRTHFVSRERSYHGNTIGAMCLSDSPGRTGPYEKAFDRLDVSFVKPAYAYRHQRSNETEAQYTARLVNEVEAEFRRIGRQNIAAFVAETVGGSTAGCITAPKGYFEGVRRVCDEYGVLLILDEIMCGSGRTGTYFAFESEGAVCPDIVVLGKGLSGGYLPLAATLINHTVDETIEKAGSTAESEFVEDIRGRGLFWAIEFVADKRLKMAFAEGFAFGAKLRQFAHKSSIAILSESGTADGRTGDHIMLAPPLTITQLELDWMTDIIKQAYLKTEEAYKNQRASK